MVQKSPARRSAKSRRNPSVCEIARKRETIQAGWSSEERRRRRPEPRTRAADPRLQAHLRFIEFLIATQGKSSAR